MVMCSFWRGSQATAPSQLRSAMCIHRLTLSGGLFEERKSSQASLNTGVLVPGGGIEPPQSFRTCGF